MKKLLIRFLLSLLIGAAMLYLASREIDFSNTWSALRATEWWVLLPFFLVMALQHYFRAWRWGHLLAPIHPVPFRRTLPVASVGFFAVIALPLRMGELVRPYLIMDPPKLRMSHSLGTLAVERVMDGLVLSLCAFIAVALARMHVAVPSWVFGAGIAALGLFIAALLVLIMALWQQDRAVALCRRIFSLVSQRLGERLAHTAEGIVDGFRVLPNWRRLSLFVGATTAYWLLNAVAVWLLGLGFKLDLTLGQAIAVMALTGVGIMIPAGPGFIGNFELFAKGALALYLPSAVIVERGAAFILTFHTANALWYVATGLLALLSPHVSFTKTWRASTEEVQEPDLARACEGKELDKELDKAAAATDSR